MATKTNTAEAQRGAQSTNTGHGGGDAIRPHAGGRALLRKIMTTKLKEITK